MDIGGIAVRDVIIGVSGLTATYLVILLLRLVQVGRHKTIAADAAWDTPPVADVADVPVAVAPPPPAVAPAPRPSLASRAAPAPSFGSELVRSQQDMDAKQLREEVGRLRAELADLRAELGQISATRHISPQYSDAMTMAQRGLTPQDVADRCDISLGEAELIAALSRGPTNFDQEEDHGSDPRSKHARAA